MGGLTETTATDINLFTETGVNRILKWAFELAAKRDNRLISVDKANVLSASLFWRRKFEKMSADYPNVVTSSQLVDSWCLLVLQDPSPAKWDVLVTDNMFGDIISDEAAAIVGSLGMSPSANFCPGGVSMFEPVHGSAPDIAGKGVVNSARHDFGGGDDAALQFRARRFGAQNRKRRAKRARRRFPHGRHLRGRAELHHAANGRSGVEISELIVSRRDADLSRLKRE